MSILSDNVILRRDIPRAMSQILELPGVRQYSESLRSPHEVKDFQHHMTKYLNIYLPDCPFEISSTYRYSAPNPENSCLEAEASIVARKHIKCGEEIKFLCGIAVPLHEEELALLRKDGMDFSIVESSRKKTVSLMLAPARFVNHRCDSNARLDLKGSAGAIITAIKNIEPGHEITVFYADDYFGDNNEGCFCEECKPGCHDIQPQQNHDANTMPNRKRARVQTSKNPSNPRNGRSAKRVKRNDQAKDPVRSAYLSPGDLCHLQLYRYPCPQT
jgi:histone-lysine N-methyltransferase SUV420H